MQNSDPIILAISLKSAQFGVAVFQGERLLFYRIFSFASSVGSADRDTRLKILKLIETFAPKVIVVEKFIYPQQKTTRLISALETVETIAKISGTSLIRQSPKAIRTFFSKIDKPTKANAARILARRYPELQRYLDNTSKWQWTYISQIFNAVALGLYTAQQFARFDNEEANPISSRDYV